VRVPNRTYVAPLLLADELARAGVRHACVTPGSRSAPLALALAGHPRLRAWSHVDERSAGFFALGLAKATRTPVVVACTSGTAAANLLPAVVEAWHARVPLVVLTADRPPELRDVGAGQTIDQLRLFGSHVRWFVELGTPEATPDAARWLRTLAARAVAAAAGPPAGPVHLNCPFREPLVPVPAGDALDLGVAAEPRGDGGWVRVAAARQAPDPHAVAEAAACLAAARRPLVVCGPLDDPDPDLPRAVAALAAALGAPVVAEAASNLRGPALAARLVDAPDALARSAAFAAAHAPDAVVRLGLAPTSKALAAWLAGLDRAAQIVLAADDGWTDPAGVVTHVLRGAPAEACLALAAAVEGRAEAERAWPERWRRAGAAARAAVAAAVEEATAPFGAHAVLALARALPEPSVLYAGNSLAIRDLDWFWPASAPAVRVLANRGANGIDGFVSCVLGAAAAEPAVPVVGLCGDLTFYHDLNGLLAVRRHGVRAVFVVLDDDGGGIFDFLPVARQPAALYETFFATPPGLDVAPIVRAYGVGFVDADRATLAGAIADALDAPRATVVRLRIARPAARAAHEAAFARGVAAVGGAA